MGHLKHEYGLSIFKPFLEFKQTVQSTPPVYENNIGLLVHKIQYRFNLKLESFIKVADKTNIIMTDESKNPPRESCEVLNSPLCPYVSKLVIDPHIIEKFKEVLDQRQFSEDLDDNHYIAITLCSPKESQNPSNSSKSSTDLKFRNFSMNNVLEFGGEELQKQIRIIAERLKTSTDLALRLPFFRTQFMIKLEKRLTQHIETENSSKDILKESTTVHEDITSVISNNEEIFKRFQIEQNKQRVFEIENQNLRSLIKNAEMMRIKLQTEKLQTAFNDKKAILLNKLINESKLIEERDKSNYSEMEKRFIEFQAKSLKLKEKTVQDKQSLKRKLKELNRTREFLVRKNEEDKKKLERLIGEKDNKNGFLEEDPIPKDSSISCKESLYKTLDQFSKETLNQMHDFKSRQNNIISNRLLVNEGISSLELENLSKDNCTSTNALSILLESNNLAYVGKKTQAISRFSKLQPTNIEINDLLKQLKDKFEKRQRHEIRSLDNTSNFLSNEVEHVLESGKHLEALTNLLEYKNQILEEIQESSGH